MPSNDAIADAFFNWQDYIAKIVSRIVPPHEVEDIVQETYVRACKFGSKQKVRYPGALMTQIARNLALDYLKSANVSLRSSKHIGDEYSANAVVAQSSNSTFDEVCSRQEFALFCESVRELPQQCRRVFVMKKVYGFSQREIAEKLQMSESTVEKHIAKGVKQCALYIRASQD